MMVFDFRSDTVTLPTSEMMEAIANAPLGDAARGDDPTVNQLESLAVDLTGKPDALFLPSGAMANLSAVIAHAPPMVAMAPRSSSKRPPISTIRRAADFPWSPEPSRAHSAGRMG